MNMKLGQVKLSSEESGVEVDETDAASVIKNQMLALMALSRYPKSEGLQKDMIVKVVTAEELGAFDYQDLVSCFRTVVREDAIKDIFLDGAARIISVQGTTPMEMKAKLDQFEAYSSLVW